MTTNEQTQDNNYNHKNDTKVLNFKILCIDSSMY